MFQLCLSCVKDNSLKRLINEKGLIVNHCDTCGENNVKALDSNKSDLINLLRALLRYYYKRHELSQSKKTGVKYIFYNENLILNNLINHEQLDPIITEVTNSLNRGVTLFSPNHSKSLKDDFHNELNHIQAQLLSKNHFLLDELFKHRFERIKDNKKITKTFSVNKEFYRARIGFDSTGLTKGLPLPPKWQHKPYGHEEIGAPPIEKANSGRMNRSGVSFLYLADTFETALYEVRPEPGQYVSIGKFIATHGIQVADFSVDIFDFYSSDEALDDFLFLKSIDDLFKEMVPPEKREKSYRFTQFLADNLRQLGYDGVQFKSTRGDGCNLTLFDPDNCQYVEEDSSVCYITKLIYEYEKQPQISKEYTPILDYDDNWIIP